MSHRGALKSTPPWGIILKLMDNGTARIAMSREDPQLRIRLPIELKEKIEDSANIFKRSMNAQIVATLEEYYETSESMRDSITLSFGNDAFNESKEVQEAFDNLMAAIREYNKKKRQSDDA